MNAETVRARAGFRRNACTLKILAVVIALASVEQASALQSRSLQADGESYRAVEIDLRHDALELHWRDRQDAAYGSIESLRTQAESEGRRLLFAANAGIYDRDVRPLGLHIEGGQTLRALNTAQGRPGAGNFSLQPNGVFYVDADHHAHVTTTAAWTAAKAHADIATQSGPMLLIDGAINPAFDAASQSRKWRSGVCAQTPERVTFAVSLAPVTFHEFAAVFRDNLHCRDALYLDGTLSQIYTAQDGYAGAPAVMLKPYAGIFAVFASRPAVRNDAR